MSCFGLSRAKRIQTESSLCSSSLIVAAFSRKTMLMRSCASAAMNSAQGARALLRTPL